MHKRKGKRVAADWQYPHVDELLVRWGVWRRIERGHMCSMQFDGMPIEDNIVRSWIPLDDLECVQTDEFVTMLEEPWRKTTFAYYTSDAGVESQARSVGCSTRTFYANIRRVHFRYILWVEKKKPQPVVAASGAICKKNF